MERGQKERIGKKKPGCSFQGEKGGLTPVLETITAVSVLFRAVHQEGKRPKPSSKNPQVGHPPAKSLRAPTTTLDITRPRSRPSISCLSPDFSLFSTGQEKEQCGSRWRCRGKKQIFPEHEDTYGPLQQEPNGVPEGVASFARSAAMLL